jgi:hypothetical protein
MDLKQIESRCKDLTNSLKTLADEKDVAEFLQIIHRPGWTTPAEVAFVHGLLDAMNAQAKHLAGLKQTLLTGARAVTPH